MSRFKLLRWAFAVGLTLLVALAGPALAQLQTGNLYGRVVGADGGALPGVTVTLSGAGAPQVQVTDENGQFRFPGLYPGTYKLAAELQGFSTLEYPDVGIRIGSNTEIEMTLSGAVEDVITVTGESPLLDQRKTNQGTSVGADELDKVPTARDPWSLLSLAPGVLVDRFNVGGNESGQQSNFLGLGSGSRDNTYAVDGVILTDMNSVGDSATYFDFGAFEEVQLTVSSADVSVATSGVTINQVTKRGTNTWRGQARYLRTDGDLQSEPSIPNANQIKAVEEYGADIGGPLMKDHLWLWASYGESDIQNLVPGANPGTQQLDRTQLEDLNTKLNFQAGTRNSGVLHYWTNDKLKFGRGASPTRAPETTYNQTTPQDIYKLEDTFIAASNFYITGLFARDDGIFTLTPQGGLDADIFRDANGVLRGTNSDFAQTAIIDQARLDVELLLQRRLQQPRAALRRRLPRAGERVRHGLAAWQVRHVRRAPRPRPRPGYGGLRAQPHGGRHLQLRLALAPGHHQPGPLDDQRRPALRQPDAGERRRFRPGQPAGPGPHPGDQLPGQ